MKHSAADISALVKKMTLEEKAGMCSGADFWHLKSVERLGIPVVMVSDGPHGVRKQDENGDNLGMNASIQAVCFPPACATACSFDRELLSGLGAIIGDECQAENVSVILGPAVNIKRSPLCGRNFEYISEDPYLASELAAAHITGVQSKNVGTSLKHFAVNNQEYRRMTCSSEVDERTLHEIYLRAFETAVKKGKPDTVMCSYNRVNGIHASEHRQLLTGVLRDKWGFDGYVVSDWGAVNDRVAGLKAGLELEMPSSNGVNDAEIVAAVKNGTLDESVLDTAVERLLRIIFKYSDNRQPGNFDKEQHHIAARQFEEESAVLLKNNGVLPIDARAHKKIAFIGAFAERPRYQGGGSSHINSFKVPGALETVRTYLADSGITGTEIVYAPGYTVSADPAAADIVDQRLLDNAVAAAKDAGIAVVFAGLPDSFESEGYDRTHMRMPESHNRLIQAVAAVCKQTVVVLHNGSPMETPWIDSVQGILDVYLGGEAVGEATVNLLFGNANPCGKLAETWPLRLEDTPSYLTFPGDGKTVTYSEGIFTGYRWYDARNMEVRFPFGFGLSYTTFAYANLKLSAATAGKNDTVTVSVDITNTGAVAGKEIVQLYIADKTNAVQRPPRELKNFCKVALNPGETKTVTMELDFRSFAWYSETIHDWYAASGTYTVEIGRSSRSIELSADIAYTAPEPLPIHVDSNTTIGELLADPRTAPFLDKYIAKLNKAFSGGSTPAEQEAVSDEMVRAMIVNSPIRAIRSFIPVTNEEISAMIADINRSCGS